MWWGGSSASPPLAMAKIPHARRRGARQSRLRETVAMLLVASGILLAMPIGQDSSLTPAGETFVIGDRSAVASAQACASQLELSRLNSPIVMHGGSRRANRQYHAKTNRALMMHQAYNRRWWNSRPDTWEMLSPFPDSLQQFSQTLKVNFLPGEHRRVTEEDVEAYFTTEDYKPEAVVFDQISVKGTKQTKAYVHFGDRHQARQAKKEKKGGPIEGKRGTVSEMTLAWVDEKRWICVRDGVQPGAGRRSYFSKAYGNEVSNDMSPYVQTKRWWRTHPVYPEEDPYPNRGPGFVGA